MPRKKKYEHHSHQELRTESPWSTYPRPVATLGHILRPAYTNKLIPVDCSGEKKWTNFSCQKETLWPFCFLYPLPPLTSPFDTPKIKPNQENSPPKGANVKRLQKICHLSCSAIQLQGHCLSCSASRLWGETLLFHPKPKMWEVEKGQTNVADLTTSLCLGNIMKRHVVYNPTICAGKD